MDQADIADHYLEDYLERAISTARGISQNTDRMSPPAIYCMDCDDKIPAARRDVILGCKRCVSCQTVFEQRARCYSGEAPSSGIDEDQLDDPLNSLA